MRVLITRLREDATPLAAELAALGHETLIEPLLTIVPRRDAEIDLAGVQAIAFTSANGARVFARLSPRRNLPVYAVGDSTAEAARRARFAEVESADGDVETLAALIATRLDPAAGAVFHAAARRVAGDLQGRLQAAGFAVSRVVLYDAEPIPAFSPATAAALRDGSIDAILFFSPRTGETFVSLMSEANLTHAYGRWHAICLSQAVADQVGDVSWRSLQVADRPTRAGLMDSLAAVAARNV
ncbi:MAG: uroporphyrinogen-III synthase [Kiloniellales bacterium]